MDSEEEYLTRLKHQRNQLVRCLTTYGKLAPADAQVSSELFYPYEPPERRNQNLNDPISLRKES
jgi:hypothetical protein